MDVHTASTAVPRLSRRRHFARRTTLDEINEKLTARSKTTGYYLHPTRGVRRISARRMRAQEAMRTEPFGARIWRAIFNAVSLAKKIGG